LLPALCCGSNTRNIFWKVGIADMKFCKLFILIAVSIIPVGCRSQTAPPLNSSDVEMIFWEQQSWEAGGGRSRLTIWVDGRSKVVVVPDEYFQPNSERLHLRDGWVMEQGEKGLYFVRANVFPQNVAKDKFNQALAAGIGLLQTFKPGYVDGSGTVVGVQINGELKETVIPMFLDQHRGSANHRRFIAVSKVLSDFDRHAYDIQD
jgi:hypothetical protein